VFKYHKQLRSFHAVAQKGGFTAAADYLNIGQPTVTEQVGDLEERFGIELFFRRGRTVELTRVGEQLFGVTKGMFNHEEEAMQLLQSIHDHQGLLRVGAVSPPIAIQLMGKVGNAYPDLKLDLSISSESETLARINDFKIDIGVLALVHQEAHLHTIPYQRHSIVAIMRPDHAFAKKRSISLRELASQPLILREQNSKTRQIVEQAAAKEDIALQSRFEINSREAIFHAVRADMGIGFVTEIEFIPTQDLCAVPIAKGRLYIDYYLCCLNSRKERPPIAAILGMK
jgi:LysR family transcriptional regulator, low CO2-responsive transcriptional regulator